MLIVLQPFLGRLGPSVHTICNGCIPIAFDREDSRALICGEVRSITWLVCDPFLTYAKPFFGCLSSICCFRLIGQSDHLIAFSPSYLFNFAFDLLVRLFSFPFPISIWSMYLLRFVRNDHWWLYRFYCIHHTFSLLLSVVGKAIKS